MSTTRKRILSAALLLPVVLFSVVWTSFALWRCQYDGVARSRCCCPKDSADRATDSSGAAKVAFIAPSACCEIEQYEVDKAPAEAGRTASQLAAMFSSAVAALPVALLPPVEVLLPRSATVWFDDDGPPGGRSLLAQKQALLI